MDVNEIMSMTAVQKADMALAQLTANGGYISERELPTFLKQAIKEAELTRECRRHLMEAREVEIPRLRFADTADDFILYPLTENAAHPIAERSRPSFGALNLTSTGFGGQVSIPDSVLHNNVEKDAIVGTVRELVYSKMAADVEKIAIRGDTTSAVTTLAALDGWVALATTHIIAAAGNRLATTYLNQAVRELPEEYDKGDVKVMTSKKAKHDWWDVLMSRGTTLGDTRVTDKGDIDYRGDLVQKYSLWPNSMGVTTDRTVALYTEPKNMVLGIFKDVRLEMGRSIENRQTVIVFDIYLAVGYEVEDGVVKIDNLLN